MMNVIIARCHSNGSDGPHRMHSVHRCGLLLRSVVCVSVCVLDTTVSLDKAAGPIKTPFGGAADRGSYGRHLANTIELSVRGGDAGRRYHYCGILL